MCFFFIVSPKIGLVKGKNRYKSAYFRNRAQKKSDFCVFGRKKAEKPRHTGLFHSFNIVLHRFIVENVFGNMIRP